MSQAAVQEDLYGAARALEQEAAKGAAQRDLDRAFPHDEIAVLKDSVLPRMLIPTWAGGLGADIGDFMRVCAILARGDSNIAQMFVVHSVLIYHINELRESDEVKRHWYRRVTEENSFFTNAYSERGTKTVFDFKTTIRKSADGSWKLNGTKFYCTGSRAGDVIYVACVDGDERDAADTSPQADLGRIRLVCVPADAPGVTIHDDWTAMGQRTTASGTIEFSDVTVKDVDCFATDADASPENLFGIIPQGAFAAIFVGIAEAALESTCEYVRAKARPWVHSGVDAATQDPYILQRIGQMSTYVNSAAALLERAADIAAEAHVRPSAEKRAQASVAISEAKAVATESALRVSEMLFQVTGAGAVLSNYNYDRYWRDTRTLSLHDPVDYKYRLIGESVLNGVAPPVTAYT